ncbi:hypothetical protein CURTO8I2_170024 [Curtobacterium sp. 8I-2]|nr:hypothetical protein CURTO8I2_170024 [Curtobacterium sp. 8I-2]
MWQPGADRPGVRHRRGQRVPRQHHEPVPRRTARLGIEVRRRFGPAEDPAVRAVRQPGAPGLGLADVEQLPGHGAHQPVRHVRDQERQEAAHPGLLVHVRLRPRVRRRPEPWGPEPVRLPLVDRRRDGSVVPARHRAEPCGDAGHDRRAQDRRREADRPVLDRVTVEDHRRHRQGEQPAVRPLELDRARQEHGDEGTEGLLRHAASRRHHRHGPGRGALRLRHHRPQRLLHLIDLT